LGTFGGVLVSDFFTVYDSLKCGQQKYLVHLVRDIGDDLMKNRLDTELKGIARDFGVLLREIIETVDSRGSRAVISANMSAPWFGYIDYSVARDLWWPSARCGTIGVMRIGSWHKLGYNPEEIALTTNLTLAQVHAALAYYHANREAIDSDLDNEASDYDRLADEQLIQIESGLEDAREH
jgi:hypothetical protein